MIAFKFMLVLVLSMLSAIAAAPVSTEEGLTKLEQKVKMLELGQRIARLEGVHKNSVKEKFSVSDIGNAIGDFTGDMGNFLTRRTDNHVALSIQGQKRHATRHKF